MLGVSIVLSSNNWLIIWAGLELNIYSFIPLLLTSKLNQEKEAAVKYFLFQALASGLLLLSRISSNFITSNSIFLLLALLMKLGMAPCHFWFPIVINRISWNMCWVLSTIQKVSPILIMLSSLSPKLSQPIIIISAINRLIGGLGGLNQTQLRPILAYSSIGHIGWILAGTISSSALSTWYFIIYLILISTIIPTIASFRIFSNNNSLWKPNSSQSDKIALVVSLLSLGGMPPTLGFIPKIFILSRLISENMFLLSILLILGSSINLYYYIKIAFNVFLSSYTSQPFSVLYPDSPRIIYTSLVLSTSIMAGMLLIPLVLM